MSSDPLQVVLGLLCVGMVGLPFWTVDGEEQADELPDANHARDRENDAPHLAVTEKVPQNLGREDAHVRGDLGEGAEEALLLGWGDLENVDGHDDDGDPRAQAGYQSTQCEDGDVGSERLAQRAQGEEDGVDAHDHEAAVACGEGT